MIATDTFLPVFWMSFLQGQRHVARYLLEHHRELIASELELKSRLVTILDDAELISEHLLELKAQQMSLLEQRKQRSSEKEEKICDDSIMDSHSIELVLRKGLVCEFSRFSTFLRGLERFLSNSTVWRFESVNNQKVLISHCRSGQRGTSCLSIYFVNIVAQMIEAGQLTAAVQLFRVVFPLSRSEQSFFAIVNSLSSFLTHHTDFFARCQELQRAFGGQDAAHANSGGDDKDDHTSGGWEDGLLDDDLIDVLGESKQPKPAMDGQSGEDRDWFSSKDTDMLVRQLRAAAGNIA